MSIETLQVTTNITPVEPEESVMDRRVRLHNEAADIIKKLHELQVRHTKLTLGLIALAEQLKTSPTESLTYTRATMAEEHRELATVINTLRDEQRTTIADITACNQTVWRPNSDNEKDKAERRRIEQPFINEIYNNGESPTQTAGLPEHLVGVNYRYLSNAPI
jgi:hypothetical protein